MPPTTISKPSKQQELDDSAPRDPDLSQHLSLELPLSPFASLVPETLWPPDLASPSSPSLAVADLNSPFVPEPATSKVLDLDYPDPQVPDLALSTHGHGLPTKFENSENSSTADVAGGFNTSLSSPFPSGEPQITPLAPTKPPDTLPPIPSRLYTVSQSASFQSTEQMSQQLPGESGNDFGPSLRLATCFENDTNKYTPAATTIPEDYQVPKPKYPDCLADSMAFRSMVHTTAHYVNFINIERTQIREVTAQNIHYKRAGDITGHFMLPTMLTTHATSHHDIHRQCSEASGYTHHPAFFFMIALHTHATGCFVRDSINPDYILAFPFYSTRHHLGYLNWRFIIWPGILYFGERVWREIRARKATRLSKVLVHPSGAMELRIIKPSLKYVPGQWLFIQVPDVSRYQWHPFTITSAPDDPYVSVHIRQVGDWTRALGECLGAGPSVVAALTSAATKSSEKQNSIGRGDFVEVDSTLENRELPVVRIDGPYGAPAEEFSSCEVAVYIGAGIGVTPFASILKHIWYRQKKGNIGSLRRIKFFWVCRDTPSFGWFQTLLQEVEAAQVDPNFLRINIYLTQKIGEDMLWNITINDTGADYNPLTLLHSRTMFGWLDWRSIFGKMREAIDGGSYLPGSKSQLKTTIGTYFCGPGALAKTIKKATEEEVTTNTIQFTFAKEHF